MSPRDEVDEAFAAWHETADAWHAPQFVSFRAGYVAGSTVPSDTREALVVPRALLESLVSDDDCDFDHHGGCQAHLYLSLEPGETCPQQQLKDLLA